MRPLDFLLNVVQTSTGQFVDHLPHYSRHSAEGGRKEVERIRTSQSGHLRVVYRLHVKPKKKGLCT